MRFSLQWLELVEISRVLLWILVERMAFVEIDVTRVSGIVVSSTPNEILYLFLNSDLSYLRVAGICFVQVVFFGR